jgi:hypothetical protein
MPSYLSSGARFLENFRNKLIFYGEELLATRPTPQAGGPPLVGCPRLLIRYIRSCPLKLEGVSSIRNLRTRHAVVTRDPPNMACNYTTLIRDFTSDSSSEKKKLNCFIWNSPHFGLTPESRYISSAPIAQKTSHVVPTE